MKLFTQLPCTKHSSIKHPAAKQSFTLQPLNVAILLFLTTLLSACAEENSVQAIKTNGIKLAKIIELEKSQAQSLLSFPAVIDSQNLTELAFEVGGLLDELLVVEAQSVKKGDIIAKLDQQDLTTKLKSAKAQYNNANKEYKRALRLIKADAISRSELDKRKSKNDIQIFKAWKRSDERNSNAYS